MSLRSALVMLSVGGLVFAVGCVENDSVVYTDAGQDVTTGNDASTDGAPTDDAATDDAGVITDGGGNPDEDGGVLIDAGADAATCGPPAGSPASINSSCTSLLALYLGGVVQPGTYHLTNFIVEGNTAYCSNTFASAPYAGRLVVTSGGSGKFTFDERVVRTNIINLQPNKSFDVTPVAKVLNVVQTCGVKLTDTAWNYSTGTTATDAGTKNYIFFTRTVGTATVRFRWVQD